MGRQRLPAPGNVVVKAALDAARVRLSQIGAWLASGSDGKKPVAAGTLNNYRNGRREMPVSMRRLLAKRLRGHARRLEQVAKELERTSGSPGGHKPS